MTTIIYKDGTVSRAKSDPLVHALLDTFVKRGRYRNRIYTSTQRVVEEV